MCNLCKCLNLNENCGYFVQFLKISSLFHSFISSMIVEALSQQLKPWFTSSFYQFPCDAATLHIIYFKDGNVCEPSEERQIKEFMCNLMSFRYAAFFLFYKSLGNFLAVCLGDVFHSYLLHDKASHKTISKVWEFPHKAKVPSNNFLPSLARFFLLSLSWR